MVKSLTAVRDTRTQRQAPGIGTAFGTLVRVWPVRKRKSRRLAQTMLDRDGGGGGGILVIDSDLPEGKGLASSSADLVATARAVGHARSALMNQQLHPKQALPQMIAICREVGGLGVVAAHSGTTLGLLLADDDPRYACRLQKARRACAALTGSVWVDHSLPLAGDLSGVAAFSPPGEVPCCTTT